MSAATAAGGVRRFLFGEDFRSPPPPPREDGAEAARLAAELSRLEAAERDAGVLGREQGRREAESETERRAVESLEALSGRCLELLADAGRRAVALEEEGLAFFRLLAERLAGTALDAQPMAGIEEAAREAFRHLRGIPHLLARVHPDLVERTDAMLARIARERGFEGRLIVLADDEVASGDARLEWADGGVARDRRALADAVASCLPHAPILSDRRSP